MANGQIVTAYRHLYRRLLQAVQYASPARHVARDQLRTAFREPGAAYDGEGVKRTIWFLEAAARERGLEHRILKNLIRVRLAQLRQLRSWRKTLHDSKQRYGCPLLASTR